MQDLRSVQGKGDGRGDCISRLGHINQETIGRNLQLVPEMLEHVGIGLVENKQAHV